MQHFFFNSFQDEDDDQNENEVDELDEELEEEKNDVDDEEENENQNDEVILLFCTIWIHTERTSVSLQTKIQKWHPNNSE